jgi:hypothetical protein
MSNYTKTTNFAAKDSLPSGDPGKIIRGTEFNVEFDNIAAAVASKANSSNPTFTGQVTVGDLTVTGDVIMILDDSDTVTINGGTY